MRSPMLAALATALSLSLTYAAPAAGADWALSHGPFTTAADVRPHNALPQDVADMRAALAQTPPDWAEALRIATFGANFAWRDGFNSLGRFGDDYNGVMSRVVPLSVALFGHPSFQSGFLYSALAGAGRFDKAAAPARIAAIEAASLATILNWTRFELDVAQSKALAAKPNWSLENGAPKNWNEIFAFHYGPGGAHSVFAALQALEGGPALNARLMAALAEGQAVLLTKTWAPEQAARIATVIDRAAILLFLDRLRAAASAPTDAQAAAHASAAGFWLAAAETVAARDAAAAATIHEAMTRAAAPILIALARDAAEAVAAAMPDA